jgi:hypothetical protein
MDLNINADTCEISTTRNSGRLNVYLNDVDENDLLSTENFQSIGLDKWVGEFGAETVLQHLKDVYPELF